MTTTEVERPKYATHYDPSEPVYCALYDRAGGGWEPIWRGWCDITTEGYLPREVPNLTAAPTTELRWGRLPITEWPR